MQGIRPTGNRVLLQRLDGDGREETLPSGIIMPARDQSLRHGNAKRVPDTFRALVVAMSDGAAKATQGALAEGDAVLVHTFEQTNQRTLAGDETPYGMLVDVENILGVEEETCSAPDHTSACAAFANAMSNRRERDQAVLSLGYHRKGGF